MARELPCATSPRGLRRIIFLGKQVFLFQWARGQAGRGHQAAILVKVGENRTVNRAGKF
jgi:hypothetical protein